MRFINVILALIVSVAIALAFGEVGLRLIGMGPPDLITEFDPELGWRKRANDSMARRSAEYDVVIQTDARGLRDDFRSDDVSAGDGEFRVLCLGDSFVLGYTVAREDLFVDQLERTWRDEGRKIDVVNAGTQAYSTDHSLVWLKEFGAEFAPDVVVHFPYENDIWWNGQPKYRGSSKPMFDTNGDRINGTLTDTSTRSWLADTAIGRLLRPSPKLEVIEGTAAGTLSVEFSSRLVEPPAETLEAEARTRAVLRGLAETSSTLGAKFAVCPIPSRAHVQGKQKTGLDAARPYDLFTAAAREAGAALIDPLPALRAQELAGESPYYEVDFHLNPRGNAILARAVYDALDTQALVPARPSSAASRAESLSAAEPRSNGGGVPRWLYGFLGLWLALSTLYATTYRDEAAGLAYLKVGALLSVVFATAIGVSTLIAALPPSTGPIVLLALVIAILTFVAYKLGSRIGTIVELLKAFVLRGHWYLMPLLSVLLTVGSLLVVAASSPLVAPFIYTLF